MSRRQPKPTTTVDLTPGRCTCGCGEETSAKARFRPGHDARLKGLLLRAQREGAAVGLVDPEASPSRSVVPAMDAAGRLSTEKHDWQQMLAARIQASPESPSTKEEQ